MNGNYYLNEQTVLRAFESLKSLDIKNSSLLHIIFILKGCGFDSVTYRPIDEISENGFEYAFLISSLFSKDEPLPDKYNFINPFTMSGWNNQSPTEPLKKWVNSRVKNNVVGGATTWRRLVNIDSNTDEIKLSYDYLNKLREMVFNDEDKINLYAFSIWTLKFFPFSKKLTLREIVDKVILLFNLNDGELEKLFERNQQIDIQYDNSEIDMSKIRRLIGTPPNVTDWVDNSSTSTLFRTNEIELKKTERVLAMNENQIVNPDYLIELLNWNYQLILSGPPGTSKSFYCDQLSSKYQKVKKIQFHPDYSYQQFIGGYVVIEDRVKYQSGVLINIIEDEMESLNEGEKYLFIIEEINRANVSQVFGETVQCLDRNYEVSLTTGDNNKIIKLPKNLHIVGTMNSSDRTIGTLDLAVRRRFLQVYCKSDPNLLIDICDSPEGISITDFLLTINSNLYNVLRNREYQIGHAFFLHESFKSGDKFVIDYKKLEMIFNLIILPIIKDFCYGDDIQLHNILGNDLPLILHGNSFINAVKEFINNK